MFKHFPSLMLSIVPMKKLNVEKTQDSLKCNYVENIKLWQKITKMISSVLNVISFILIELKECKVKLSRYLSAT